VQQEKPAPGLATSNLVMSRAEVKDRGGAGVDSGYDLLGGGTAAPTTPRRGEGRGTTQRGGVGAARDGARRSDRRGVARRGMGAPPRGGLGRANGAVSRNE
jgi:hypothetical protein